MNSIFNWLFRNNNGSRRGQSRSPQEGRNWLSIVVLFLLNSYSFYTSYKGAEQILPVIALPLALFIQSVLFLALAGLAVKFSVFFRKWFAILIFMGLSIYTSFFFYDSLTEETIANRNRERAIAAHSRLVSKIYTPVKSKYNQLRQEADFLRRKAEYERKRELTTENVVCGPKCQQSEIEALKKESKRDGLAFQVNELDRLYDYELDKLSPSEIFEQDKLALSQTPREFLPEEYRNLELQRKEYIDEDNEVRFLAPYYKLNSDDELIKKFARNSWVAALLVDSMMIVLVIVQSLRRRQNSTFREFRDKFAYLINDSREGCLKLIMTIRYIRQPDFTINLDSDDNPDIEIINKELERLRRRKNARSFESSDDFDYFETFLRSIEDKPPLRINYQILKDSGFDYRPVIDALRYHGVIEVLNARNRELRVNPDYYQYLTNWLNSQIARSQNRQKRPKISYSSWGFEEQNQNQSN